jgi:hypothetical protein
MRVWVLEKVNMPSFHGVMQQGPRGGSRMSTSLLYHGFGLVGYRYVRREFREGRVIFPIEQPRERSACRPSAPNRCSCTSRSPGCVALTAARSGRSSSASPTPRSTTPAPSSGTSAGTRSRTSRPAPCNAASASPSCTSSSRSPSTRSPSAKAITTSPWYSMCRPGRWRPSATAKASRP